MLRCTQTMLHCMIWCFTAFSRCFDAKGTWFARTEGVLYCKVLHGALPQSNTSLVFENRRCIGQLQFPYEYTSLSFLYFMGQSPHSIQPWFVRTISVLLRAKFAQDLLRIWSVAKQCQPISQVHFTFEAKNWPDTPRERFKVRIHVKKLTMSSIDDKVFTRQLLPFFGLLSPATTVHREPLTLEHSFKALHMA